MEHTGNTEVTGGASLQLSSVYSTWSGWSVPSCRTSEEQELRQSTAVRFRLSPGHLGWPQHLTIRVISPARQEKTISKPNIMKLG